MVVENECVTLGKVAMDKLQEAIKVWYDYYGSLPVGENRCWAAEIHSNLQHATRDAASRYAPNETA